jgi:membrane protein required for colicin V production
MTKTDWICLAVLGVSTVWGLWRGLASELLGLLSWLAAFVLAQWYGEAAASWLPMAGAPELLRVSAGFVLVFVLSVIAGSLLAFVLRSALSAAGLGPADRALGAVFGAGRGVLVLLVFSVVVALTPWRDDPAWSESRTAAVSDTVLRGLMPWLSPGFSKYLPESLRAG